MINCTINGTVHIFFLKKSYLSPRCPKLHNFFFHCIAWYIFCYFMVLHDIALYDLVSYVIYFAYFYVFRFVARALSRKTPIPSIHHLDHLAQPTHPNQSTLLIWIIWLIQLNPPIRLFICYLSFVICHLVFFICHLFICYLLHCCLLHCLVYILLPYGITWYCIV